MNRQRHSSRPCTHPGGTISNTHGLITQPIATTCIDRQTDRQTDSQMCTHPGRSTPDTHGLVTQSIAHTLVDIFVGGGRGGT